jgi:CheY-like chemotaxis protein
VYQDHVTLMAAHAADCLTEMAGLTVMSRNVAALEADRFVYVISRGGAFQTADTSGRVRVGLTDREAALELTAALADRLGLTSSDALDDQAVDLLLEYLGTFMGRASGDWLDRDCRLDLDAPGLDFDDQAPVGSETYELILGLAFRQLKFVVDFRFQSTTAAAPPRVLVVDDSSVIRTYVVQALEAEGIDVRSAGDGAEGVRLFKEFQPQVVVMDLTMPNMGGLEAIEAIQAVAPNTQFLVLTSISRKDKVLAARELGVTAYVLKPPQAEVIVGRVGKLLKRAQDTNAN